MTAKEAAKKWNISQRRVSILCAENRITGAMMFGKQWMIPNDAKKPIDGRTMRKIEKNNSFPKPIIKWAGGKTQLLDSLLIKIPETYNKYIEPFFGGGALFFSLKPQIGVIADSNPELINMYKQVADHVDEVISHLMNYENSEEMFYSVRSQDWTEMPPAEAAARTIFLNKTCFNGLYRVNRNGQFNVPFGRYKNPKICDTNTLKAASEILQKTVIICGDYLDVLREYAKPGDLVFLDPPYVPISEFSDFKRYTKVQFKEEDHIRLANEVKRLTKLGCHIILTNSNAPLVQELYQEYEYEIIQSKRHISCKGDRRTGEDVIVTNPLKKTFQIQLQPAELNEQIKKYPATRYMGAKSKLLPYIWAIASQFEFNTVADLFSGSGIVSYMFKSYGKTVISNDYMAMSNSYAKAIIENNNTRLSQDEVEELIQKPNNYSHFVREKFSGLYFTDEENDLIDIIRFNIGNMENRYKQAIAMTALIRACIKKRPRGIFTYVGHRYDDGRKDLRKSLQKQFFEAVQAINESIFDNGKNNQAFCEDALALNISTPDLVYIDPPYYSPLSDNEYVRRYHFVEGLARNWQGVEIQENTLTKKFKSYPTPFSSRIGAENAFDELFRKYKDSILVISYSSNSQPNMEEMIALMKRYKKNVEVVPVDHRYSFGNQGHKVGNNRNDVQEYIFVGY